MKTEEQKLQEFKDLVKIYAVANTLNDMVDSGMTKRLFKQQTKRQLNLVVKSLERDCQKQINALYDTDDKLFQYLQVSLENMSEEVISKTIEEFIGDEVKRQEGK